MQQYSFIEESFNGGVLGTMTGLFAGFGIGHIVDYIRSSGARAEADAARIKWLQQHKNDYTNKEIINYLNSVIERSERMIEENKQALNILLQKMKNITEELAALNKLEKTTSTTSYADKDGYGSSTTWESYNKDEIYELREKKRRIESEISSVQYNITKSNNNIVRCKTILANKSYHITRSELVNRDADAERQRIYHAKKKISGKLIGGGLGAAFGGYSGHKLGDKYKF